DVLYHIVLLYQLHKDTKSLRKLLFPMLGNSVKHFLMNVSIAGHNLASKNIIAAVRKLSHLASCFLHNNSAACHIPGIEVKLKEPLKATHRHIGQVERGRTQTAHAMRFAHKTAQHLQVLLCEPKLVV